MREENDLSLTNHLLVADALVSAKAAMPDTADEIFLVSTSIADKRWIAILRHAEKTYYDDDASGPKQTSPRANPLPGDGAGW